MPMTTRSWAMCGQANGDPRLSPDSAAGTDEAAVATCYTKRTLARFLDISTRSLDRAIAAGLLPTPDLTVGSSPRWSPSTIERWLRSHPRLPGRGKRGGA